LLCKATIVQIQTQTDICLLANKLAIHQPSISQ